MRLQFEKSYPWFAGAAVLLLFLAWSYAHQPFAPGDQAFSAAIDVAALTIAFLAAMKALFITMPETPAIKGVKEMGGWERLLAYFSESIYVGFAVVVISFAALILGARVEEIAWVFWVLVPAWFFLLGVAGFGALRVIHISFRLLTLKPAGPASR